MSAVSPMKLPDSLPDPPANPTPASESIPPARPALTRPALTREERRIEAAGRNFLRMKDDYGIVAGGQLGAVIRQLPSSTTHVVEGLIPPRSVNILVGDSGIGKSPLAYQLGLAVASGTPFLDMPVQQGKVLLVDFENSLTDLRWIMMQQRKHLGLEKFPYTFQVWPMHLNPMQDRVEEVVAIFKPDLVILDSLRSFSPTMESDSCAAVDQIKRLRVIAAESGTAFLLIHHVRKQAAGRFRLSGELEDSEVMEWLLRTAGVRALINQTDVRLALAPRRRAAPSRRSPPPDSPADGEEAGLVLRGHFRTRGEVGPFLLRRKRADGDGEPLGYERFAAEAALLGNPEHEDLFARLPEEFSFKDLRLLWGKSHESARELIHKMMRLGLARRVEYGQYRKEGCTVGKAASG